MAAARQQVLDPDVRLLTLTGPPGIGKSRLSLEVAASLVDEFERGVVFVDLAPISDPALVDSTIAQTIGLEESPDEPLPTRLRHYLHEKRLLLVLDNVDRVLTLAAHVADLLAECPNLKILVTSRERLHLILEHELPVPALFLPDLPRSETPEVLAGYPAVALFIERARALKPDFVLTNHNGPAVAEICTCLDGLPLAIELAAARIKLFSPLAMLIELRSGPNLPTEAARLVPTAGNALRAIEWTYNLLDLREQALLRRLFAFIEGFTSEAVKALCDDAEWDPQVDAREALASLVDKGLLWQEDVEGEPRFRVLPTIQEYGLQTLAEIGEQEESQRHHAAYFLTLAERADRESARAEREVWLNRLEREHHNLRAALKRMADRAEWDAVLRLAAALGGFWSARGHSSEGRKWLTEALEKSSGKSGPVRAKAIRRAAHLTHFQGDFAAAQPLYEQGLALAQALGDKAGIIFCQFGLGNLAWHRADYVLARSFFKQNLALSRELGDKASVADVLSLLGQHATSIENNHTLGRRLCEESLAIRRELDDTLGMAASLLDLGTAAERAGDIAASRRFHEEALPLWRAANHRMGLSMTLNSLGNVAVAHGAFEQARGHYDEALAIALEVGHKWGIGEALSGLGHVALNEGRLTTARTLHEQSLALYRRVGSRTWIADGLADLGRTVMYQGDNDRAVELLEESLLLSRDAGLESVVAGSLCTLGMAAECRGELQKAAAFYRESLVLRWQLTCKHGVAECLERLAAIDGLRNKNGRPARFLGAAEVLREAMGTPIPVVDRSRYDHTVSTLHSRLGEKAFAVAFAEGRRMPLNQIVEEARRDDRQPEAATLAPLTAREQEVAVLIARGFSNRDIAATLVITQGTAQNHIQHILNKLGVNSRTQIVAWMLEHGVVPKTT